MMANICCKNILSKYNHSNLKFFPYCFNIPNEFFFFFPNEFYSGSNVGSNFSVSNLFYFFFKTMLFRNVLVLKWMTAFYC